MKRTIKFCAVTFISAICFFISSGSNASGMTKEELNEFWNDSLKKELPSTDCTLTLYKEVLSTAETDECFNGVGNPCPALPCNEGQPKINQEYLFSMAKTGNDIWFGTSANQFCTVVGTFLDTITSVAGFSILSDSFVCEFGRSDFRNNYVPTNPYLSELPAPLGDWRPPKIYVYNTQTKMRIDKTPADDLINDTLGIRSSGISGDTVIMGGPNLISSYLGATEGAAINLFVFRAGTGAYLGSKAFVDYIDIRKWIVIGNHLYAAVKYSDGSGRVLKWTGNADSVDIDDILKFEEVGLLDAEGAELAFHDGRIFVTTWAQPSESVSSGIYMSPPVPAGGLTGAHLNGWTKFWGAGDYEPDPVLAKAYFMGAVASFDGYIYWGTINFPFVSFLTHMMFYNPTEENDIVSAFLGAWRNISIFRASGFDGNPSDPTIEVVNGFDLLPAYSPSTGWSLQPNKTGPALYGPSGFGNIFNSYTWTMAAYNNELYVGTMDSSYMLYKIGEVLIGSLFEGKTSSKDEISLFLKGFLDGASGAGKDQSALDLFFGADLWRFPKSDMHALLESLDGLGNNAAYGIRNMLVDDGLYAGTANVANLLANTENLPHGGWELLRLTKLGVTVNTDNTEIVADGTSTAVITASVTYQDGNPVPDGTEVTFKTNKGYFPSLIVTQPTVNGTATAILTSEPSNKTLIATVTARVSFVKDALAVFFVPEGGTGVEETRTGGITGSGTTDVTVKGISEVQLDSLIHFAPYNVTTAQYSGNPCSGILENVHQYVDVHIDTLIGVTEVRVLFCPAQPNDQIYYCGGSGWEPCSSQFYENGCIVVNINLETSPNLNDLSGLPFALVRQPPMQIPALSWFGVILLCLFAVFSGFWVMRRSSFEGKRI